MAEGSSHGRGVFRLEWRTLFWVAGINILPTLISYPFFGPGFTFGLWMIALLPASIASSLSPLLRIPFKYKLMLLAGLACVSSFIVFFVLTTLAADYPLRASGLVAASTIILPFIDACNAVQYQYQMAKRKGVNSLSEFFDRDPATL